MANRRRKRIGKPVPTGTRLPAFVIGNGPSRAAIDCEKLKEYGIVWGCNALYRDFSPHFLVVVDKNMQNEIVKSNYHLEHACYFKTRTENPPIHDNIIPFTQKHTSPNNSGVSALYFAIKAQHRTIYLIGFDLFNPTDSCNIYAGTDNYKEHIRRPPKIRRGIPEKISEWAVRNTPLNSFYRVVSLDQSWLPKDFAEAHNKLMNNTYSPWLENLKGLEEPNMHTILYDEFKEKYNV